MTRARLLALVADLACATAFAAAGQRTHEPGEALLGVLAIAWPFLLGAAVAHGVLAVRGLDPAGLRAGASVLATTYVAGMVLRALSGRGMDPAFLVVALVSLSVTLLGWRAVVAGIRGRRTRQPA